MLLVRKRFKRMLNSIGPSCDASYRKQQFLFRTYIAMSSCAISLTVSPLVKLHPNSGYLLRRFVHEGSGLLPCFDAIDDSQV